MHSVSGLFEVRHVDWRHIAQTSVHPPGPYATALGDRTKGSGSWGRSFWCSGSPGYIFDSQSMTVSLPTPASAVRCRHGARAASVVDLCGQCKPSLAVRAVKSARARLAKWEPSFSLSWTTKGMPPSQPGRRQLVCYWRVCHNTQNVLSSLESSVRIWNGRW